MFPKYVTIRNRPRHIWNVSIKFLPQIVFFFSKEVTVLTVSFFLFVIPNPLYGCFPFVFYAFFYCIKFLQTKGENNIFFISSRWVLRLEQFSFQFSPYILKKKKNLKKSISFYIFHLWKHDVYIILLQRIRGFPCMHHPWLVIFIRHKAEFWFQNLKHARRYCVN